MVEQSGSTAEEQRERVAQALDGVQRQWRSRPGSDLPRSVADWVVARLVASTQDDAAPVAALREQVPTAWSRTEPAFAFAVLGAIDDFIFECLAALLACGALGARSLEAARDAAAQARASALGSLATLEASSLHKALAARDRQLQVATHELRTPISTIVLNLQMLERACRDKQALDCGIVTKLLAVPKRQLSRLMHMVDLLLDSAQVESDRLVLDPQEMDLCAAVHDVVGRHSELAREHGCALLLGFCEPVIGRWDRLRIEQVVNNLVNNGIKYGGSRVEVHARRTGSEAQIVVADQGGGIPAEDQERIFAPYERLSTASSGDGAGLGLYIVREIVRAHGGSVRVESTPGAGTTFTVNLPILTNKDEQPDGDDRQAA